MYFSDGFILYWIIGLVAVPLIIHLFNFRRTRIVYFSTIKFIHSLKDETKSKRRIKHWLLLTNRILLIVFLGIAFASLFLSSEDRKMQNTGNVYYLDNSESMSAEVVAGTSAFVEGISLGQSLVENLEETQRSALILNEEKGALNWSNKHSNLSKLSIAKISTEDQQFSTLNKNVKGELPGARMFVISDFQKTSFENVVFDSLERIDLIRINTSDIANLYVDSVYIDDYNKTDERRRLNVVVKNGGLGNAREVNMKVISDGQLLSSHVLSTETGDQEVITVELLKNAHNKSIQLELGDFPITFDNKFFVTIPAGKKARIAHYRENVIPVDAIGNVFGNKGLFDLKTFGGEDVDYDWIGQSDLIVLEDITTIPSWAESFKGIDVLIIPSQEELDYQSLMSFTGLNLSSDKDSVLRSTRIGDREHPIFTNMFEKNVDNQDLPLMKRIMSISGRGSDLLSDDFGNSYLRHLKFNNRNVFILASPIMPAYSNIARHAIFLPLLYGMTSSSDVVSEPIYYSSDGTDLLTTSVERQQVEESIFLKGTGGEIIPEHQYTQGELKVDVTSLGLMPGHYVITNSTDTLRQFSINRSSEESELATYSLNELNEIASNKPYVNVYEASDIIDKDLASVMSGGDKSLVNYALVLALICVVVEALLIRFL